MVSVILWSMPKNQGVIPVSPFVNSNLEIEIFFEKFTLQIRRDNFEKHPLTVRLGGWGLQVKPVIMSLTARKTNNKR